LAFKQEDLQKLEEAIAQGALRVRYSDKEVTYRSLAEMLQIRDLMLRHLKKGEKNSFINPTFSKGLN
jgi:hypothetical protein